MPNNNNGKCYEKTLFMQSKTCQLNGSDGEPHERTTHSCLSFEFVCDIEILFEDAIPSLDRTGDINRAAIMKLGFFFVRPFFSSSPIQLYGFRTQLIIIKCKQIQCILIGCERSSCVYDVYDDSRW